MVVEKPYLREIDAVEKTSIILLLQYRDSLIQCTPVTQSLLLVAEPLTYIVKRKKNVYIGIIAHCLMNSIDFIIGLVFILSL